MRLRRLSLDYFGHFTGQSYDFGAADGSDFHVIYGPNEAGKTTTMEAILRLFYGFPTRETYDFQHQRKSLQVSGIVEMDGVARDLIRQTGRKGALSDASGASLPEAALSAHLGGLTQEEYRTLLCLDDETIEKGGEAIASSKGDIGRLLFSAAAGLGDLGAVLDQAGAQADALYRKRASSTQMAALKKELAEVEKTIRESDVSASAFTRLKTELAQAQALEADLRDARDSQARALARVAAQQSALPLVMEHDGLAAHIAQCADYPAHLDITAEALVAVLTEDSKAEGDIARLSDEVAQVQGQIAELALNLDRQDLARRLADLDDLRSRHLTAARDLPRRRAELDGLRSRMTDAARALEATGDAAGLVLTPAQIARLEAARDACRAAAGACDAEEREVATLQARVDEAENTLSGHAAPEDTGIGALLERYDAGNLQGAHATARAEVGAAEAALKTALDGLHFKGQDFDALPPCPVSFTEVQALADQHDATSRAKAQALERMREQHALAEEAAAQIARSEAEVGQISDADAQDTRAARDALWTAHRADLSATSAEVFEQAMHQSDTISDARLTHARALADLRTAEQAQTRAETQATQARAEADRCQQRLDDLTQAAANAASEAGLQQPASPADLAAWVAAHDVARTAGQVARRCGETHAATLDKAARLADELAALIDLDAPDFASLIDAARRRVAQYQKSAETLAQAISVRDACAKDLGARADRLKGLSADRDARAQDWADCVADACGGQVRADVLDASLEPLRTLAGLDDKRAGMAERVGKLEQDRAQFAKVMGDLAKQHGIDASDTDAIVDVLRSMAEEATAAQTLHGTLTATLARAQDALQAAQDTRADIARKVAVWSAAFPDHVATDTLPELRAAVTEGETVNAARRRMAALDAQVRLALSVETLAEARALLADCTSADLDAQAATAVTERDSLTARLETAIAARANAQSALTAITGDTDIAQLTERRATLELQMEDCALSYLELRMGQRLAEEALRRYRDTHRSGMMQATEAAFSMLTRGAYARLGTQQGANGAETLLAIDAAGTAKQAQDLSKGTRFQLYLALRAAAYSQLVGQGVRLPFLCDDIFETFDEDRTAAACLVMEEIGHSGQAIYLTHHRHVVEIAKKVCTKPPKVHMIGVAEALDV